MLKLLLYCWATFGIGEEYNDDYVMRNLSLYGGAFYAEMRLALSAELARRIVDGMVIES